MTDKSRPGAAAPDNTFATEAANAPGTTPGTMAGASPDYRDTVFLPSTAFPMRGDLPRREPEILARWERQRVWERTKAGMAGRPQFVLQDGPIYSNGHLHIGHALNRILKDVVLRAHRMAGEDAGFVPGWDCHGLPIEWKVEEGYRSNSQDKDAIPVEKVRADCRAYSAHWMEVQAEEFRRLGVVGDWDQRYSTMDFSSEAAIAEEIGRFLLNGELYRGLRPVMWSPVERTALAEAEVEYHERTSETVYVRVRVLSEGPLEGASAVYWTTTPWTVPGTRGLTLGPAIDYALVRVDQVAEGSHAAPGERLLVALALLPAFCEATGVALHHVERVLHGAELEGLRGAHPLQAHPVDGAQYRMELPFVTADYVTSDQGTGFVPCAPAHGEEDFDVGRRNGLEVPDTVDPDGRLSAFVGSLAGTHVFKSGDPVSAALEAAGTLVGRGTLRHSYPHSWRSKAPIILRATPQWFIALDGPGRIRERALEEIARTRFVPEGGRTRLSSMVANRPDWCVSRQRAWGVPIPVFVDRRTGEPLRDPAVVERVAAAFREEGADCWFSSPPERFLGSDPDGAVRDPAAYEQVMDIVDVWFESGCTHGFAQEAIGRPWPADLYLEGSDQHRGWFQSSLLEAVGTRGAAPFRAVLTHGFVLDEHGRKMSKSLGNVTAPQAVMDQYGADILRLWTVNSDVTEDLRIGKEILKQQAELYRRLRNTLRWVLGSLAGFTEAERIERSAMPELERWVLHRLSELDALVRRAVETHDWTGVYPALHAFCASDLSAFYFDVRKDALYCDRPDSLRRRAARTVLDVLHRCLCAWLAPALCFTADEAWTARFGEDSCVHLELFPAIPPDWRDEGLAQRWEQVRAIRRRVTVPLEEARRVGAIGASLQAAVRLPLSPEEARLLAPDEWAEICIVSAVELVAEASRGGMRPEAGSVMPGAIEGAAAEVAISRAPGEKCARCWRVLPEVGTDRAHPALCLRCADAVGSGLVCQPVTAMVAPAAAVAATADAAE